MKMSDTLHYTSANNVKSKRDLHEVTYVGTECECQQELKPRYEAKKSSTLFLYLTIFVIQIPAFSTGANLVWNSPAVPMLLSNDTQINPLREPATTADISVIAGSPSIAGLIGGLTLPKFSDYLGRKLFLQITVFMTLLGAILLTFSTSVSMIVVAKCFSMLFAAGGAGVIPIYITEICEDHNRANFGCLIGVFLQLGHFYTFIVGPLFNYKMLNFIISFPIILFLVVFPFFPETPVYLMSKGRRAVCRKVLRKLRSNKNSDEIREDMEKLEESLKSREHTRKKGNFTIVTLFKTKEGRVGFLLALLPLAVQHLSGVSVILFFMAPFFDSAGTSFSGHKVALIVSVVKISCMTFTSAVIERVGRKKMLLISTLGTGVPLFGLGWFFYLKNIHSPIIHHVQWLPIVFVLSNVAFYSLGLGPIPTAIMHEMFTPQSRAAAGSILSAVISLIISCLISSYPFIAATGTHWAVWLYSFSCFVGAALIYKFLPQTHGKNLSEIQELLKHY